MSVDLEKATWHDHETDEAGGCLDLITRETRLEGKARFEWLDQHGFHLERDDGGARKPNGNGSSGLGSIVATYDYVDEIGALLFQVLRFDPKDFRQRRRDPAGDGNGPYVACARCRTSCPS